MVLMNHRFLSTVRSLGSILSAYGHLLKRPEGCAQRAGELLDTAIRPLSPLLGLFSSCEAFLLRREDENPSVLKNSYIKEQELFPFRTTNIQRLFENASILQKFLFSTFPASSDYL